MKRSARKYRLAVTAAALAMFVVGCSSQTTADSGADRSVAANQSSPTGSASAATRAAIEAAIADSMAQYHLKALIVRVTIDGQDVYTTAVGDSMTGVPATPQMKFRNGAFAFTYIGQIFAKLSDQGRVSLDDKLATWYPDYPQASEISVRNLLNMTSGYADYVRQPELVDMVQDDPFRQWTNDDLLAIGFGAPQLFAPGTNWGYSHTNYVVLTQVLSKITGKPMAEVMDEYIIKPMELTATSGNDDTPNIPEPVLHSFTSERSEFFAVPSNMQLYEEGTFWNPSWTTGEGAVQTSNIFDVTRSMEIVGSGMQVSPEMYAAQTQAQLVGLGEPTVTCPDCRAQTEAASYGLGVILRGPWITQTKSFAGNAATAGYLPADKLAVSVAMTYSPAAFTSAIDLNSSSAATFNAIVSAVAPGKAPGR